MFNIIVATLLLIYGQFIGSLITVLVDKYTSDFFDKIETLLSHVVNCIIIFIFLFFTFPLLAYWYKFYLVGQFHFLYLYTGKLKQQI